MCSILKITFVLNLHKKSKIVSKMDPCDIANLDGPCNVYTGASHLYHTPATICSVIISVTAHYNSISCS